MISLIEELFQGVLHHTGIAQGIVAVRHPGHAAHHVIQHMAMKKPVTVLLGVKLEDDFLHGATFTVCLGANSPRSRSTPGKNDQCRCMGWCIMVRLLSVMRTTSPFSILILSASESGTPFMLQIYRHMLPVRFSRIRRTGRCSCESVGNCGSFGRFQVVVVVLGKHIHAGHRHAGHIHAGHIHIVLTLPCSSFFLPILSILIPFVHRTGASPPSWFLPIPVGWP